MMNKQTLWETTIKIITDYDPLLVEIDDLARDALTGDAYCTMRTFEVVEDNETLGEGVLEFFNSEENKHDSE